MSDKVESDITSADDLGQTQDSGGSPSDVPSSISPDFTEAQLQAIFQSDAFSKEVQRYSNKEIAKLSKQVTDELSAVDSFAKKIESGMSPEDAKWQLRVDSALDYIDKLRGSEAPVLGSGPAQAPASVNASSKSLLEAAAKAKLDLSSITSADHVELAGLLDSSKDQADLENLVFKKKAEIVSRQPTPSPGTMIQPGGGQASPPQKVEDLVTELDELLVNDENPERQEEIEGLLREAGEID